MKRLFDACVAGLAIIVVCPIILLCGILVRISSPGPILFHQERIGRHGKPFNLIKFRTMYTKELDSNDPQITIGNDRRITPIGFYLRAWKLDELPQLWNVLIGDMSIVGPRPEVPRYVANYSQSQRKLILSVRPGITDPSSIYFRHESDILAKSADPEKYYLDVILPQKLEISARYIANRTIFSDFLVILKTISAIIR